jgi:hypothetical protein
MVLPESRWTCYGVQFSGLDMADPEKAGEKRSAIEQVNAFDGYFSGLFQGVDSRARKLLPLKARQIPPSSHA